MKQFNSRKILPGMKKNIILKNYTTFKIGGPAKHFFIAKTKENLIESINFAKKFKLSFFILGGGSNLLVSDKGFNSLVIKVQYSKFQILNSKIITEAGAPLASLVSEAAEKSLTGLEWAAGIPGTAGGAVYGNAGAFGKSIKNIVKQVEVFNVKEKKIKVLKNKDCKFNYRDSIFKKQKNLIILSIEIQLAKSNKKEIKNKIKKYLNIKKTQQPVNYFSAGSVFKNTKDFSAAELIEKCNLKGKIIGKAKISEQHANFIVNLGGAKAKDVKKLINLIKKQVKNKFKINLEEEIQYLGV